MPEFKIDILIVGIIGSGFSFLVVDDQIQEMFLVLAMRAVILEFDCQIFLVLGNPHISRIDFIVSDLLFRIFSFPHSHDFFGQDLFYFSYLNIIVISLHRFFQLFEYHKGALPVFILVTDPSVSIAREHCFSIIQSEIEILAIRADQIDGADDQ